VIAGLQERATTDQDAVERLNEGICANLGHKSGTDLSAKGDSGLQLLVPDRSIRP
jgi:hypothetical protein